jgi:hypothetical protein
MTSPYLRGCAEAARYLAVGTRSVEEWSRRLEIPHRRLAGRGSPCLFDVRELEAWWALGPHERGIVVEDWPNGGRRVRMRSRDIA